MDKYKFNIDRGAVFGSEESEEGGKVAVAKGCPCSCKLSSTDWLSEYGKPQQDNIFEVKFKNTRRGFYANVNNLPLERGDIVAVEAIPGHDIGVITLTGDMVTKQMRRTGFRTDDVEFKKIYRKAKPYDIEKWQEAIANEHQTMIEARIIAADLGLNMKIGDVEYQGDRLKAIFYYIADERVDFRELIKIFADRFKIRVEMKQIGARQEAGRIGGIGACGRELCCASFISNFVSVTTNSARFQEIMINPQKLAGQCGKLKCCMNYEVDAYIDARKSFPRINEPIESIDSKYYLVKSDIFKKEMTFSTDPNIYANLVTVSTDRVWEIIKLNRKGIKVDVIDNRTVTKSDSIDYGNVVGQESITRFDKNSNDRRRGGGRGNNRNNSRQQRNNSGQPSSNRNDNQNNRGKEGAGAQQRTRPQRSNGEAVDSKQPQQSKPTQQQQPKQQSQQQPQQPRSNNNNRRRNNNNRPPRAKKSVEKE